MGGRKERERERERERRLFEIRDLRDIREIQRVSNAKDHVERKIHAEVRRGLHFHRVVGLKSKRGGGGYVVVT